MSTHLHSNFTARPINNDHLIFENRLLGIDVNTSDIMHTIPTTINQGRITNDPELRPFTLASFSSTYFLPNTAGSSFFYKHEPPSLELHWRFPSCGTMVRRCHIQSVSTTTSTNRLKVFQKRGMK